MTAKPLKFGEVEWVPYSHFDGFCRCDGVDDDGEPCDGSMCSAAAEAEEFIGAEGPEDAAGWWFGLSKVDGSIVMAKKREESK